MLQQTIPRTIITLLCTVTLILSSTFMSCYKLDPLSSNDTTPVSPSTGGVGEDVTTITQLGATDSGGWIMTTDFFDNANASVGEAKISADADLVSYISAQNIKVPGTTQLSLNNLGSVTISVTEASETKYRVQLTNNAAPAVPVWFLIDNLGDAGALGKKSTIDSQEQAAFVDPAVFAGYIATHIVMLIANPNSLMDQLRECREEAIAKCGSINRISEFYIIVSFSLQYGLNIDCYATCIHDQGGFGF